MKDNEQIKSYIRTAKALRDDIDQYKSLDVQSAYRKTAQRINNTGRKRRLIRFMYRAAAILLLPLLFTTTFFSYKYLGGSTRPGDPVYMTITSAPGIVTQFELPDQSKVWLNAGSQLRYPSVFTGNERKVYLEGEGYFEVESSREKPFYVVLQEELHVKAHGTKFNINSYPDDARIETTLESGKVDVTIGHQSVSLQPNEIATYDKKNHSLLVSRTEIYEKISWKDGWVVFRNTSLEDVMKSLSRRYNIDIVVHNPGNKEYKLRATFSTETIRQALDYIRIAAPIEWTFSEVVQRTDSTYSRQRIDVTIN